MAYVYKQTKELILDFYWEGKLRVSKQPETISFKSSPRDYYYYYLLLIPSFSHEDQGAYNQFKNNYKYM